MEKKSDIELMSLIITRDTEAFRVLYKRYSTQIFNLILRYSGNRETAQDLLQETFTRIWFAAHTFNIEKKNFRGWMFTIALNITRNEMSKKRYRTYFKNIHEISGTGHEPGSPEDEQPDQILEHLELKRTIAGSINELPQLLREIVILKHYHQLKFREISEMTDTPEGTLKARYHRSIAQLKNLIEIKEL